MLQNIGIQSSYISLGNRVFDGCSSLKNIMHPSTITSITSDFSMNVHYLLKILLPKSATKTKVKAFNGCLLLIDIIIQPLVISIGKINKL